MSELRVDSVKSKGGGAPDLPKGVTISGITTAATLGATTVDVSNVNVSGVVTSGTLNGPLLSTGTPTLGLGVTINSSGLHISGVATAGIVSATTLYGDGTNLTGIGASIAPLFYNPDVYDRTVTLGTGIGFTFNQQIKAGSGDINLRLVSAGGTIVQAFGVGSSVTISENKLEFTPTSDLSEDTIYFVDIPGSAITNNEGTAYVGTGFTFQSKYTLNSLYGWGKNGIGAVGANSGTYYSSPVQVPGVTWKALGNKTGYTSYASLASKTDGTLWIWGRNSYGELGQNSTVHRSSPVQLPGTTWGTTYSTMSSGYQAVYNVKTNGTFWSWGYNYSGELGHNNRTKYSSPTQVGSDTTWAKVYGGFNCAMAIKTDNTLWVWGTNQHGQLGINQPHGYMTSSPTQVPGTWARMANGFVANYGIRTDGTLWAMGSANYGKLGNNTGGTPARRSSPVQIPGTNWSYVKGGYYGAMATKTDGTLWVWGGNDRGQIGDNTAVQRSSPTQVGSSTDWDGSAIGKLGGGGTPGCFGAVKTDGTLWAWGSNTDGGLGQNSRTGYSSPVQIPGTWSSLTGPLDRSGFHSLKSIDY